MDFSVVPLHQNKQYVEECCTLINSEWKRSDAARLHSLNASSDALPTSLILLHEEQVIGHAKLSSLPSIPDACFVESVVIKNALRGQGWGRILMEETEKYAKSYLQLNIIYLSTKNQEGFYAKLGYVICEPISVYGSCMPNQATPAREDKDKTEYSDFRASEPPPMPTLISKPTKVYMMKEL